MMRIRELERYIVRAFRVKLDKCQGLYCDEHFHYSKGLTRIRYGDPKSARKVIYEFARYFQREFQYDFIQYSIDPERSSNDNNTQAFLFHHYDVGVHNDRIAYGACCFRYRKNWTNLEPHWALQWIYLHPLCRNEGELTRHWETFETVFGNFMVEEPLSKSMEYFIENKPSKYKHDYKEITIPAPDESNTTQSP